MIGAHIRYCVFQLSKVNDHLNRVNKAEPDLSKLTKRAMVKMKKRKKGRTKENKHFTVNELYINLLLFVTRPHRPPKYLVVFSVHTKLHLYGKMPKTSLTLFIHMSMSRQM